MDKKAYLFFILSIIILLGTTHFVHAATGENDLRIASGIEFDSFIILGSGILAATLFILTMIAYKRDGRARLLYVSIAFFLFAIKSFLLASDLFIPNKGAWVDPVANLLDLGILFSFFAGLLKK